MYIWKHFRVLLQRQLASPFPSVGSKSVSWLISGNLMKCCEFPLWWSMSRADFFFWLCKSNNIPISSSPSFAPRNSMMYISYYHRYLHCHPGLLWQLCSYCQMVKYYHLASTNPYLIPRDTMEPGSLPSSTVNKDQKKITPTKFLK